MRHITVIDNEEDVRGLISNAASDMGLTCFTTADPTEFLTEVKNDQCLLMMDLKMPNIDGVELLRKLAEQHCPCKIIMMSDVDTRVLESARALATSLGLEVIGILHKPFSLSDLQALWASNMKNVKHGQEKNKNKANDIQITRDSLLQALSSKELIAVYQPQVNVATGALVGMEALARWPHPKYGYVNPEDFIYKAEEFGIVDQIDWYVASMAIRDLHQIYNQFDIKPTLSINASPFSLRDIAFPDRLREVVKENGINLENVIIEVIESNLLKDLTTTLDILTRSRLMGFNLSLDDFGTGYAMLQQLQNMPCNEIKIDRFLTRDIGNRKSSEIMIQKTIEMAHELNMIVVGEGVETAEQLEFLRKSNCDHAQGYLISKPLSLGELCTWINNIVG